MLEIRHKMIHDGASIQSAYDELYQTTELQMRDSFYLWLLELLAPQSGAQLLDIACGQGRLVQLAARQGVVAIGLDLSFEGLSKGARHTPEAQWIVGDGQCIPLLDASVDYIMNIGSLEHYDDPLQGMHEIYRLLKKDGRACILLPNAFGALGNIRRVWQTGEIFDDRQPRQRYATRKTWEAMLTRSGLEIERLTSFGEVNFPRTPTDLLWTLKRPQKLLRLIIAALTPINLANHFIFICRRTSDPTPPTYYPMFPIA